MDKEILILKNIEREGPGLILDIFERNGVKYQILDFDEKLSIDPAEYGAVIILGGPESANDISKKMQNELHFIRNAVNTDIPYLGICLGMQTLVKAMDGEVIRCHDTETGFRNRDGIFYNVHLTDDGIADPLFRGLPTDFKVFQLHGETVVPSPSMTILGTGNICINQAVKAAPKAYGLQFHTELTDELLQTWLLEDPDLARLDSKKIKADFELIKNEYQLIGRKIILNFLELSGYQLAS